MNYTNAKIPFRNVLEQELRRASAVDIAVGFCGLSAVTNYAEELKRIARIGRVRLVLGMYRSQGAFSQGLYNALVALDKELEQAATANGRTDGTGVYVTLVDYHGKLWRFQQGIVSTLWIGSNNFSDAGLENRLEACVKADQNDLNDLSQYIDNLCDSSVAKRIQNFSFTTAPSASRLAAITPLKALPAGVQPVASMDIVLRVRQQPCSSLNLSQGKGCVSKGIYTPRPWYEVELTADKEERQNPIYPKPATVTKDAKGRDDNKCTFKAYLSDGKKYWPVELSTYSDNNKALASTPREILGEFMKSRLEANTSLRRGDTITEDILAEYGRNSVTLTKLSNGEYVLTF